MAEEGAVLKMIASEGSNLPHSKPLIEVILILKLLDDLCESSMKGLQIGYFQQIYRMIEDELFPDISNTENIRLVILDKFGSKFVTPMMPKYLLIKTFFTDQYYMSYYFLRDLYAEPPCMIRIVLEIENP